MKAAGRLAPSGGRPVPFAWLAIVHLKLRTTLAVSGISFAVLFMFMQLSFYGTVANTALAISSRLDGDLVLASPRFLHLNETGTISSARLYQALAVPEVASAIPLHIGRLTWRSLATDSRCSMAFIAVPTGDVTALRLPEVTRRLPDLRETNTVLIDRLSQAKCAPFDVGAEAEVRGLRMKIVGQFDLGVGFLGDGAMIFSQETLSLLRGRPLTDHDLGLLKLRPGASREQVAERLRQILPADTRVLTTEEVDRLQTRHWVFDTAMGNMFALGTLVGFFVGLVVLYQVLSTDIRNQLPQYATLKAMGYRDARLYRFVLQQSWILGILGYLPSLALACAICMVARGLTRMPIFMTAERALVVLLLSLVMCTLSGLLSLRKVSSADPAELF